MDSHTERSTPRRLTRRSSERVLAGVASGLGDYTGVDPVFFRIGFIILTIAGGSGILLYLLGWLVIPEEHQPDAIGTRLVERMKGKRWLAIAMIAIATIMLFNWAGMEGVDWSFLWAAGLIAIGFVLLRDEPTTRPETAKEVRAEGAPTLPIVDRAPARPRRPRSPLGFMTLGAAFVAIALAVLLSMAEVFVLDMGQYLGLGVTVLGGGLIVSAWWGRARLLVLVATLLVPVMVLASMIDVPLEGSIGATSHYPRAELPDEYQMLVGSLDLDLSRYRFGDEPTEVDISFVAGDVNVFVPEGVRVTVTGTMDVGVSDLFGRGAQGRSLDLNGTFYRNGLTEGELILNVDGGFGSMDTTWATWVDHNKRLEMRLEQRKERKERSDAREEAKGDGRDRAPKRKSD